MLTMKLYLGSDGTATRVDKDFPLIQGQYNNVLLNVFVPTSFLSPNFKTEENYLNPFISGTVCVVACESFLRNGTKVVSQNYNCIFVKKLVKDNVEYALFQRKLPKEFTANYGECKIVCNIKNIDYGITNASESTITYNNTYSWQIQKTETFAEKVIPIQQSYKFEYEVDHWHIGGLSVNLADFGLELKNGTPSNGQGFTLTVKTSKPMLISVATSQTATVSVLESANLVNNDEELTDTELATINASINRLQDLYINLLDKIGEVEGSVNDLSDSLAELMALVGDFDDLPYPNNTITENIARVKQEIPTPEELAYDIDMHLDTTNYKLTIRLKNQVDGDMGSDDYVHTVDLPLESVVVDGRYDSANKKVILTLQNGTEISFSVADLIDGLQTQLNETQLAAVNSGINSALVNMISAHDTAITNLETSMANVESTTTLNSSNIGKIVSGETPVGVAMKAKLDENGSNIVNTYMTKENAKNYVKDYALPRVFNDIRYFNFVDGVFEKGIPASDKQSKDFALSSIGDNIVTTVYTPLEQDGVVYQLANKNSYQLELDASMQSVETVQLKINVGIKKNGTETILGSEVRQIEIGRGENKISIIGTLNNIADGEFYEFDSNTCQLFVKIIINRATSTSNTINLASSPVRKSFLYLNVNILATTVAPIMQETGNSTTATMSQDAITRELGNKLDKVTTTTEHTQAYIKDNDGSQNMMDVCVTSTGHTIAQRGGTGTLAVADPLSETHAVNKRTMEEYVAEHGGAKIKLVFLEEN